MMRMTEGVVIRPRGVRHRFTALVVAMGIVLRVVGVAPPVAAQQRLDALELYRQGRYEAAVEVTTAELTVDPTNLDAYTVLGWSLLALQRNDEALRYGVEGLGVSRFDHRLVNVVGEAHFRLGNYLESLQYMRNYAALAPTGALIDEVYYVMGEIHIRLEEYHHADIALTTAVYLNGNRAQWWARLGYAREMAQSPREAADAYRRALESNPSLIEARRGLERVTG